MTWTADSVPVGVTIETDGMILWTPSNDQFGPQTLSLIATTADGETQSFDFEIDVRGRLQNSTPTIVSTPNASVSLGDTFEYDVSVVDADNDTHSFALLDAPAGISLHSRRGTLRWTPAEDQLGRHEITVEVVDPNGAIVRQKFTLDVSRFGGPPRIVSVPPTAASVGTAYRYTVEAIDREGDPLTYTLLSAPNGMSITETTGEIVWTPVADQTGTQEIVIQVSDGIGGATTQAYVIDVTDGAANLAPTILSTSPRFAAVDTPFNYTLIADDPENTTITYSVPRGPAGLSIDAATGVVTWTPSAAEAGRQVVTFVATDADGAAAIESLEIDVLAANNAPAITSNAPQTATAGALFAYDVLATDPDTDALRFELTQSPIGATIDAFGRIRWQSRLDQSGDFDFTVVVRDPRDGTDSQSFTLSLVADTTAPTISLIESPDDDSRNILPWQGPFTVFARAIDEVGVASLTITANGIDIPLSATGTATFTFEDWGFTNINVTATAIDTSGNTSTESIVFNYDIPEGWSGPGAENVPTTIITSPADTASVTGMVEITGTASHEDFAIYRLSYRGIDETTFTEFFTSETAVENGVLATWDTSLLSNDEYVIRLEVATTGGVANVVEHNVGLGGELKLGNFRLSFTDMVIPVAGIPIEITRIYDTLQSDREGAFGYGWRLEYRDTDLRVGLPESGLEDIGIYSPLRPGVKVYLNVPGEGRQGFTFNPDIRVLPGFGGNNLVLGRPRFTPDPGVTSTLSTGTNSYLTVNERGELFAPGQIPYNPASPDFGGAYVLTTRTGITYRIDGATGKLDSARDANNNQIDFNDFGITSNTGRSIDIDRDSRGRVSSIENANGERYAYQYHSNGSLESVTDAGGNVSQFTYDTAASRPNRLVDVIDPLGNTGIRAAYDDNGRIVSVTDPNGNSLDVETFVGASSQELTDALGNVSSVQFDNLGNAAVETDALGNQVRRDHNASGDVTQLTDELGRTTRFVYDGFRNLLSQTDATGRVTRYEYANPARGLISRIINPDGTVTSFQYDSRGNLLHTETPDGNIQTATYDQRGRILTETLPSGDQRTFQYDAFGNLIRSVDEDQQIHTFAYDAVGQLLQSTQNRLVAGVPTDVTQSFEYDAAGNLIRATDSLGGETISQFDANGRIKQTTDPLGRQTHFLYDDNGNETTVILPDDTPGDDSDNPRIENRYDALDRVIATVDASGNETRFTYDALGRQTDVIFADDTPADNSDNPRESSVYDGAGQVTATTDALGNETQFEYDTNGNLIRGINAVGDSARFQYDVLDRVVQQTDETGATQINRYDTAGRIISNTNNAGDSSTISYDVAGRPIQHTDESGTQTRYRFDTAGRVIAATDPQGNTNEFRYDNSGNLIAQIDATGRETTFQYDALGRRIRTTRPDGSFDSSIYDAAGNQIQYIDFAGNVHTFQYDSQDRMILRTVPGIGDTSFTYTDDGLLETETDTRGTTTYGYDNRRRLVSIQTPDGNTLEYSLDDNGSVLSMTTLLGETRYVYDDLDRIISLTDTNGETTTFTYDPVGRPLTTTYPNGLTETHTYSDVGFLLRIRLADATDTAFADIQYEVDANGRRTAKTTLDGTRETYAYDDAGRLLLLQRFAAGQSTPDGETHYTYDEVGNSVAETDESGNTTTYNYDVNDRLLQTVATNGSTTNNTTYTYDANGNRISKTDSGLTTNYEFTADNRMIGVDLDGDSTTDIQYAYDASGNLVSRTQAGQTIHYQLDLSDPLAEIVVDYQSDGTPIAGYTYATGIVSQQRGGETYSYHTDGLGSVNAITDNTATVVNQYAYDAFGETRSESTAIENPFLFDGQRRDTATGLDYLRARHYDSQTGRLIGVDPFEGTPLQTNSIHDFTYAGNDPINASDPTGRFTLLEVSFASESLVKIQKSFASSAQSGLKRAGKIADNLIAPGTQMQNIGLNLAFNTQLVQQPGFFEQRSRSDRGYDLFLIGSEYRQAGFQALRIAISGIYADTLADLAISAATDFAKLAGKSSPQLKRVVEGYESLKKQVTTFNRRSKYAGGPQIPTSIKIKSPIDVAIDGYINATDKSLSRAGLYGFLAGTQTEFEKGIKEAQAFGERLNDAIAEFNEFGS
ncbi:MAG: putative Ig domain-containing protein [Planctomycetota bacterium]